MMKRKYMASISVIVWWELLLSLINKILIWLTLNHFSTIQWPQSEWQLNTGITLAALMMSAIQMVAKIFNHINADDIIYVIDGK